MNMRERFEMAIQAEGAGDKYTAIRIYSEILEADPRFAPAYLNLGTIYFNMSHYESAEDEYRKATVADPDYPLAFFNLGNVLDELGRLDEAIICYQRAIELDATYADPHFNLARIYTLKHDRDNAERCWAGYLRLDGSGEWADRARDEIRKLILETAVDQKGGK